MPRSLAWPPGGAERTAERTQAPGAPLLALAWVRHAGWSTLVRGAGQAEQARRPDPAARAVAHWRPHGQQS
jgi:hypothetical protein